MKMPVEKLTIPLKVSYLNSCEKDVVDITVVSSREVKDDYSEKSFIRLMSTSYGVGRTQERQISMSISFSMHGMMSSATYHSACQWTTGPLLMTVLHIRTASGKFWPDHRVPGMVNQRQK